VSTRTVLGAVGAAIGGYYGGAQGAQWGWMIGSTIGGVVDPQIIKGPSIGDLGAQTSQEGVPRPFTYGTSPPMAGNIIASGPPRIVRTRQTQGKGGPKVESESVFRTYAIGACEGRKGRFLRVWRNNVLVYDVTDATQLTNVENGAFLQKARFFLGGYDQNPSPDLEAIFGVGTTPAHRGTCYMVIADEDLTDLRGAIPQYLFQVSDGTPPPARIIYFSNATWHKPDGLLSVDVEKAMGGGAGGGSGSTGSAERARSGGMGGGGGGVSQALGIAADDLPDEVDVIIGGGGAGGAPVSSDSLGRNGNDGFDGGDTSFGSFCVAGGGIRGRGGNVAGGGPQDLGATGHGGIGNLANGGDGGPGGGPDSHPATAGGDSTLGGGGGGGGGGRDSGFNYGDPAAGGIGNAMGSDPALVQLGGGGGGTGFPACGVSGEAGETADDLLGGGGGGGGSTGCAAENAIAGDAGSGGGFGGGGGGGGATTAIGSPITGQGGTGASAFLVLNQVFEEFVGALTLAEIVADLCLRAGLPAELIDVSELEEIIVPGFAVINTYPCSAACQVLSQIYFFDPASCDRIVHFVLRGGNSVATITEDDLLEDIEGAQGEKRSDAIAIPRVLNLNYFDIEGGLATSKQTSERSGDRRAVGDSTLQTAVVLRADDAARAVTINHKVMIETQRGEVNFQLPDSFLGLAPTNPIILQWEGRSERLLISKMEICDGYQTYTSTRDRQSAYTSNVEGIPPAPQTPPPSGIVGPTRLEILDIHILRDSDDNVGLAYYVAVSGLLPAWQGALIELSMDGGATYIDSQSTRVSAIIGELLTALPDHPQAFPDVVHSVQVRIETPLAELEESDLTGLLNRQNLAIVGDEIINFAGADETTAGTWELSYFLRGRKGTSTATHAIGARFVLLERQLLGFIPAELTDVGRTLTFRATSFGAATDTATVVSIPYTGRSQIERKPSYLFARRDGADAVVEWQGVGRLGGGAMVAQGSRFAGYRVTYDDGVLPAITVETVDESDTQDVSALGAPLTIRVHQLNTLTGEGPAAEVILQ
jgi:hypothetical protein